MTDIIIALISAVSVAVISPLISAGIARRKHKAERAEQKEDCKTEWQKSIDKRLAEGDERMNAMSAEISAQKEIIQLMLEGVMLITGHLVDGNHTAKLKDYSGKVDEFLRSKV